MKEKMIEATIGIPVGLSMPARDRGQPVTERRLVMIRLSDLIEEIQKIALLHGAFIHAKDSNSTPSWITLDIKTPDGLDKDRGDDFARLKIAELLLETCPKSDD